MSQEDLAKSDIISRILKRAKNDPKFKELLSAFINLNEELVRSSPIRLPNGRPLVINDKYMALSEALAKGVATIGEDPHEIAMKILSAAGELTGRMNDKGRAFIWTISVLLGVAAGAYIFFKSGKSWAPLNVALIVTLGARFLLKLWSNK